MTTDERVDDIMRRWFIWIEAGAQKPFRWNGEVFDFVYLDDEGLRRFLITKIVEAGRQDGAEEMREKCAKIIGGAYSSWMNAELSGKEAFNEGKEKIRALGENAGKAA